MRSPLVGLHLTFIIVTLKCQCQGHSAFKGVYLYMYAITKIWDAQPSNLTLSDPETSKSQSHRLLRLVYHKAAALGYVLLLNTNRKWYEKSKSS